MHPTRFGWVVILAGILGGCGVPATRQPASEGPAAPPTESSGLEEVVILAKGLE